MRKTLLLLIGGLLVLVVMPAQAQSTVHTFEGAFQRFEGGYMLWRGDTGDIWVLLADGSTRYFAEATYEAWPDNPIDTSPPEGRFRPVSGFGRVWGHEPTLRSSLNWGVAAERAYTMRWEHIALIGGGAIGFVVNLPDGFQVLLRDNNTWDFYPAEESTPPPAKPQIEASYQTFQRGFMLYWTDRGTIWTLYDDGRARAFVTEEYATLPLNRVTPPDGLYAPRFGFGRVWGNFGGVSEGLGWATIPEERYYDMTRELIYSPSPGSSAFSYIITLPDERVIQIFDYGAWTMRSRSYLP